ncbi:MAG TPA: phosphate regulon sensor histidine kinase PhoR, partial [Caldimonas sp.]|nr:phosphate regulon sensor histidine kinase PhoR [Caldimonas sp.]
LIPRVLAALAAMALGGILGLMLGPVQAAIPGLFLGCAFAVAALAIVDRLRGRQLLGWLRGGLEGPAPRDAGFWGELAYRIERAVRGAEQGARIERERLAQFLSAIEASPNGVLLLDAGEHIEWCSARAADHFALDPKRDRRQRLTNLVRVPAFVAHLQSGSFDEPVVFRAPRDQRTLSVLVRPYGEGQKLLLSQDLTEQERSEGMRRDFVANVSHEIRTPLTVLSGFLETLANLPLTDAERRKVVMMMKQQAQRMATLVDDLLTLAQLEGSPRPPADRWTDLASLLALIEAEGRALSAGRHALSFHGATGLEVAGADKELQSAVGNLVNNAVRYTPEGGRIDVSWHLQADGTAEIAVADTGPGIAREHLPRLTERFYRVDGSRSRETGGTGLGLSIVKHVVQRHGGELEIRSELGKGSVFRIVLPAARVRMHASVAAPVGEAGEVQPAARR